MFAKLMKHEFKATSRIVPFVYLVTLFMILTNLSVRQLGIQWLSSLFLALLILSGVAEILMTYVLVIFRYYKNLYNSEGYLMHTLPVRAGDLFWSKLIVSFFWLFISYLVMIGVVLTTMLVVAGEQGQSLGQVIDMLRSGAGLQKDSLTWLVAAMSGYLCLSILYFLAQVFFAITLGNLSRFHHLGIGAPIIGYLITNFLLQLGTLASMVVIPLGLTIENGNLHFVSKSMLVTILNPDEPVFGLGSILFILVATACLYLSTIKLLRKCTSLR